MGTDFRSYQFYFERGTTQVFQKHHEWLSVAIFEIGIWFQSFRSILSLYYFASIVSISLIVVNLNHEKMHRILALFLLLFGTSILVNNLNLVRFISALLAWLAVYSVTGRKRPAHSMRVFLPLFGVGLVHASFFFITVVLALCSLRYVERLRALAFVAVLALTPLMEFVLDLLSFYPPIFRYELQLGLGGVATKLYLVPFFLINYFVFFFVRKSSGKVVDTLLTFSSLMLPVAVLYYEAFGERLFYIVATASVVIFPSLLSKVFQSRSNQIVISAGVVSMLFGISTYKYFIFRQAEYNYQSIIVNFFL